MKYGIGFLFLLLTSCALVTPEKPQSVPEAVPELPSNVQEDKPQIETLSPVILWLDTARSYRLITPEDAMTRLEQQKATPDALSSFKRALLYQQLAQLDGWVNARDLFRQLANDTALEPTQRDLALLYQSYNQANINAQQQLQNKNQQLALQQQQIESLQNQISELELKVKALTTLEQSISDRKAQSVEE